ncbi:hypothetical protein K492DRAFT_196269 [Lichtheimia hyalospora FSU 10163]|nr:hypothetical protein K492DRAFT_196269 [Lichtheimia hyalospora FSU 10163]
MYRAKNRKKRIQREHEQRMRQQMDNWEQHVRQQQTTNIVLESELPPPPYEQALPSTTVTVQEGATSPTSERSDHQAISIPPPAYKDHQQDTRVR